MNQIGPEDFSEIVAIVNSALEKLKVMAATSNRNRAMGWLETATQILTTPELEGPSGAVQILEKPKIAPAPRVGCSKCGSTRAEIVNAMIKAKRKI